MFFHEGTALWLPEPMTHDSSLIYNSVFESLWVNKPKWYLSCWEMDGGIWVWLVTKTKSLARYRVTCGTASDGPRGGPKWLESMGALSSLFTLTVATIILVTQWGSVVKRVSTRPPRFSLSPFHPPPNKKPHCAHWTLVPWMGPLLQPHFWVCSSFPKCDGFDVNLQNHKIEDLERISEMVWSNLILFLIGNRKEEKEDRKVKRLVQDKAVGWPQISLIHCPQI